MMIENFTALCDRAFMILFVLSQVKNYYYEMRADRLLSDLAADQPPLPEPLPSRNEVLGCLAMIIHPKE